MRKTTYSSGLALAMKVSTMRFLRDDVVNKLFCLQMVSLTHAPEWGAHDQDGLGYRVRPFYRVWLGGQVRRNVSCGCLVASTLLYKTRLSTLSEDIYLIDRSNGVQSILPWLCSVTSCITAMEVGVKQPGMFLLRLPKLRCIVWFTPSNPYASGWKPMSDLDWWIFVKSPGVVKNFVIVCGFADSLIQAARLL